MGGSAVVASQICEIMQNTKKIQNYSSSRSSKVTYFRVNEMSITDYVLEYNNFSLRDEDSENIASERYENRHLRRPLSCLTPHISRTPAYICITLISLETTFSAADSMGLSAFKFLWWAPKDRQVMHTHTHTTVLRLCGNCPGQPGWAGTRRNIHPLHSS